MSQETNLFLVVTVLTCLDKLPRPATVQKGHAGRSPREAGVCELLSFGQVVNIPSFVVRLDSQKHIDFSLKSPFGGGRPGRVKRKNAKKGDDGDAGSDDE